MTVNRNRFVFLIIVFVSVLVYALFFCHGKWFSAPGNKLHHLQEGKNKTSAPASIGTHKTAFADPIGQFDLKHAPYVDKRIVYGLEEAFREYPRLFAKESKGNGDLVPEISSAIQQLSSDEYRISYHVGLGTKKKSYEIILSTKGQKLPENLNTASQILGEFSKDFSDYIIPYASVKTVTSEKNREIEPLISLLDENDLLDALEIIETEISEGKIDPKLFLETSEIYAWLSFLRSTNSTNDLVNKLAFEAVGNYLIADLLHNASEPPSSYYGGLLFLSLHYENEALKKLKSVQGGEETKAAILAAYIKHEIDELKEYLKARSSNTVLVRYLLARTYTATSLKKQAFEELERLINDYPDFLMAKEYLVDIGTVGLGRRYAEDLINDTIDNDLHLMKCAFNTDWVAEDMDLSLAASTETNQEQVLPKWIAIHRKIIDGSKTFRRPGLVLPPDLLKDLLKEGLLNRIYVYYELYAENIASLSQASHILDMLKQTYPDSDIVKGLKIKLLMKYAKYDAVQKYVETLDKTKADTFLLDNIMEIYRSWPRAEKWPHIVDGLSEYRKKVNPDSWGSHSLFYYYKTLMYRPVAIAYLRRAKGLNSYDASAYIHLARLGDENVMEKAEALFQSHYGFQLDLANRYEKKKEFEKAIQCYRKAIAMSPEDNYAYKYLGDIYEEQENPDEAIQVWNDYLAHDDSSLKAVHIENRIGNLYLKQGEYKEAYDIFNKAKDSYQRSALEGFGHACEKLNRPLVAEEYFKKATKRYPNGDAPTDYALFYLRQGNPKTACRVLGEYERYHNPSYYFSQLIDYFAEQGDPRKAIAIVREVNRNKKNHGYLEQLARTYSGKEYYDIASELYAELAAHKDDLRSGKYVRYAGAFFDNSVKGKLQPREKILSDALSMLVDNIGFRIAFGSMLISMEYYDEGYQVFEEVNRTLSQDKQTTLLMLSLAWRGGNRLPERKALILQDMDKYHIQGWYRNVIRYVLGDIDEKEILRMVDNRDKACEINYYMGLVSSMENRQEESIKHLLISLETKASRNLEYRYAHEKLSSIIKASN